MGIKPKNYKMLAILISIFGFFSLTYAYASHGFSCSIDCEPPTIWKTIHGSQLKNGLTINNKNYTIEKWRQDIPTTNATVGQPIAILLRMYENYGYRAITHVSIYFDENKTTSVTWEQNMDKILQLS